MTTTSSSSTHLRPAAADHTRGVRLYVPLALFSCLGFIFITLGSQVYLVEILALFVCIHALLTRTPSLVPTAISTTLLLWLFATVVSDLVNESQVTDAIKGIARAGMLLILLFALSFLVQRDEDRVLSLWFGVAGSLLLAIVLLPNSYLSGEPWKFGFAQPISLLALLIAATRLRPFAILIAGSMAGVNFVMGSRSLAIICMITALALVVRSRKQSGKGAIRLILVSAIGLALIVIIVSLYDDLALAGAFGDARRSRASYQSSGDLGVFLTGRGEAFFSLRSIVERPLFGVGSYAPPTQEVFDAQILFLQNEGYGSVAANYLGDGLRSFHSEILGAVAENGILAAPFWLVVGGYLLFGLASVLRGSARRPELVAFLCSYGLWDLFFSPFGADRRFWVAATLVTIVTLCGRGERDAGLDHNHQL